MSDIYKHVSFLVIKCRYKNICFKNHCKYMCIHISDGAKRQMVHFMCVTSSFICSTLRHWPRVDKSLVRKWVVLNSFPSPAQDLLSMSFINFYHYFVLLLLLNDSTHLQQRSEFSQNFWFMGWIDHPGALVILLHCCQVPIGKIYYNIDL